MRYFQYCLYRYKFSHIILYSYSVQELYVTCHSKSVYRFFFQIVWWIWEAKRSNLLIQYHCLAGSSPLGMILAGFFPFNNVFFFYVDISILSHSNSTRVRFTKFKTMIRYNARNSLEELLKKTCSIYPVNKMFSRQIFVITKQ